jgi:hypothetical protein
MSYHLQLPTPGLSRRAGGGLCGAGVPPAGRAGGHPQPLAKNPNQPKTPTTRMGGGNCGVGILPAGREGGEAVGQPTGHMSLNHNKYQPRGRAGEIVVRASRLPNGRVGGSLTQPLPYPAGPAQEQGHEYHPPGHLVSWNQNATAFTDADGWGKRYELMANSYCY